MRKRTLGVDIGGTDIKFGVIEDGKIIVKNKIPTLYKDNEDMLVDYIASECRQLINEYSIEKVGVGVPGDVKEKIVLASGNLPFDNTPLGYMLSEKLGMNVNIENDGNCAALGELVFGEGKSFKDIIMLTVGTGIGGAIIINGEIYRGRGHAGELGHLVIEKGGRVCPCGQNGCFEQYASATALVSEAKCAALRDRNSVLYKLYEESGNEIDGKIFFEALSSGCSVAEKVFDNYTDYFAEGIKSYKMIFDPDIIVISGGITKAGDAFLNPVKEKVKKDVLIKISSLQGDAGILGASLV